MSNPNKDVVGSIYGRSSIKNAHFVPTHYQTWPPQAILVSDWLISKNSSPLKLLSHMNRNLVGSIYGRSFVRIAHFVPIRLQTWPPQTILVSDWLISKNSSPLKPLYQKVSVHLAEWFQRRRLKCEKITDDERWTTDAK
jgi:hypothetical protein